MTKKLRVTVEGKTYDVLVEVLPDSGETVPARPAASVPVASAPVAPVPVAAPSPPLRPAAPAPAAGEGEAFPSPLAGKIVSVDVAVGQAVKEGDKLMVLEAMKMNTVISAPRSAVIRSIAVAPGQAVAEGQTLVTLA